MSKVPTISSSTSSSPSTSGSTPSYLPIKKGVQGVPPNSRIHLRAGLSGMKAGCPLRLLLLYCLCAIAFPGLSHALPLDLHVFPDDPRWGDPVVVLLVGGLDPSCSRVDSVFCSQTAAYRLDMNVLIVRTQERCLAIWEAFAENCVFNHLPFGDYTIVARVFYDDLSEPPALVDSVAFSVKLPTATHASSWGHVRGLFR